MAGQRKQEINGALENALYNAFTRLLQGNSDAKLANKLGFSRMAINLWKLRRNKFSFSRLSQIVKIFPELESVIINTLNGNMLYKNIEELSKQEKIELVKKIVESMGD